MNNDEIQQVADRIRITCMQMAYHAREIHLSSSLSCVEILAALYSGWLNWDSNNLKDEKRDRFILSKGHACSTLYATYAAFGHIDPQSLNTYGQPNKAYFNHPCKYALPLLETSSGSLGHGLGTAAGMAYALREIKKNNTSRAVVLMGDGECNEGSVWEAALFASTNRLSRLLTIVDHNKTQAVGKYADVSGATSLAEKFKSFGWACEEIDGHDIGALLKVLNQFPLSPDKPTAIIAHTTSGKGFSFTENVQYWFYRRPSEEDMENALAETDAKPLYTMSDNT